MADAFTTTTALSGQVLTAYQRSAYLALRAGAVFDSVYTVKPGDVTSPGNPVKFTVWTDMAAATATLSETVDVDAVAVADSQITVTPAEKGNAVLVTIKIRTDSFLIGFDADVAGLVSWNLTDSIDTLAATGVDGAGTQMTVDDGPEGSLLVADVLTANKVRQMRALLASNNVMPFSGNKYMSLIHPNTAYDLKSETGDAAWLASAIRQNLPAIQNSSIGSFAGFEFAESSRCDINVDGGTTTEDVYTTNFFGAQAFAKAVSIEPHIVPGPVTDKLRRFMPLGWHAYLGHGEFRSAASYRMLSVSSIGAN